jgi:hypothetical protein
VVVDHIDDLGYLSAGQLPPGDIDLSHLIWQLGFEADQRATRTLLVLRDDQPLTPQNAPDRRETGNVLVVLGEVVSDRVAFYSPTVNIPPPL